MTSVVTGIALLGVSCPALAHHEPASFDGTKSITITGTVSPFQFENPHVQLFLDGKDNKGNIEKWIGEDASTNVPVREGWDRKTIKTGNQSIATGQPARNRANDMRIDKVVLPNGRELTMEGPART
jgi:hypothetical protein